MDKEGRCFVFCTAQWMQRHTTSHLEHIDKRSLPVLGYQLSSGAGFRPSLQPSRSPLIFPSFSWWRSFTVLKTKVAPFPELLWGVKACVFIYFFLFSGRQKPARHQDYCSYICGGCIQCLICMIFVADSIACRLHF